MKKKDEITTELETLGACLLAGEGADNVFHTPDDYFQQFPGEMVTVIHAMNAETVFNSEAGKNNPYPIPDHYFEQLSQDIIVNIRSMNAIVHQGAYSWQDKGKKTPYSLPDDYFTQFEYHLYDRLFSREIVAATEIAILSPLLAELKKEHPFHVPEGYFNSEPFSHHKQERTVQAKIVQHPSVRSNKWAKWAAAAAVIAIFSLGGFHYLHILNPVSTGHSFEQALAKIPDTKIKEWLANNMDESDINNLGSSLVNMNNINTNHSLKNFSEKEIQDYLETETW